MKYSSRVPPEGRPGPDPDSVGLLLSAWPADEGPRFPGVTTLHGSDGDARASGVPGTLGCLLTGCQMLVVVVMFGLLLVVTAMLMAAFPTRVVGQMSHWAGTSGLYRFEVSLRIVLGTVMIVVANDSRFPVLFQAIGGLSMAAGIVFVILPRSRFECMLRWVIGRFGDYTRVGALVPLVAGGFLIYGVS